MKKSAEFIIEPHIFIMHPKDRGFIGQSVLRLDNGELLMSAQCGRPPLDFTNLNGDVHMPTIYRSCDGGISWNKAGKFNMKWDLEGIISDGGLTLLSLCDNRIAALFHTHVSGMKGGGLPAISFSSDNGSNWTDAKSLCKEQLPYYVMNDRLIQLKCGRLVVPVACSVGDFEGDKDQSLCFYSDDGGENWKKSSTPVPNPKGERGMAEPCVVELSDGRLLLLARTGMGAHYKSYSQDKGETWSMAEKTSLIAACSPLTLKKMPDNRLIVVYNCAENVEKGAFFPRNPLAYAVSNDEGESWSEPVIIDAEGIENEANSFSHIYPSICFLEDGILVLYSSHFSDNTFNPKTEEQRKIGGGKMCLIKYPK